jgi:hypothetical protein
MTYLGQRTQTNDSDFSTYNKIIIYFDSKKQPSGYAINDTTILQYTLKIMTEEKKMEKMHAMVLTKTDKIETTPLQFTTVNKPTINKENELLVEIKACGAVTLICV